ncbi:MAG: polyprenyl synthetase family protein, partial [Bacteroidetes bacterium]|nr:polyprenyl synthetase family protein [Bacteroidota bacterium]
RRPYVTLQEYLRMIELKTAVLLAACLKTGAIIGGSSDRDAGLMYEFGKNLGLAFQVQDDLLDVYADPGSFGKKTGGDIVSNKKTLLLIKALETAQGEELKRLQELISAREFDPDQKVAEVREIYDSLGMKKLSEEIAGEYIGKAFGYFNEVAVKTDRKENLLQLASGLIGRNM